MRRKENRRTQKIIVAFIAFIMVSSVIGFIWGRDTEQQQKYKEFKFGRTADKWHTLINGKRIFFSYFPSEVEGINISSDVIDKLSNKFEIDTTSDINDSYAKGIALSQYELGDALDFNLGVYLRIGLTANTSYNLPIITCLTATDKIPVIYFKGSNETIVHLEEDCIVVETDSNENFVRIKDRILYALAGVID